jgi:4,5:9,10-diseco-3-hydroxy-5,9,17-trioxoandrosta-1(10),2-diene-4-oate hydrolase
METRRSQVGAESTARSVVVDGVRLAYDDAGGGPPLVCLHSIAHGAGDFADLRARLCDRYRVIALDWPGHGRSDDDRHPASAERYAELLEGFVDALGLGELVVLGNSIGGAAAIRFAARRSARTRGLVLVDSAGLDRVDALARAVTRSMAAFFAAGVRGARWFPRAFALYYRVVLPGAPARPQRDRIVAAAPELAPRLVEAWRSFGEPSADLRGVAAGISCSVLVAWAKRDRIIQLRRNRPGIARIPNATLELFDGGHAAFLECPEEFARSLAAFLERTWAHLGDARRPQARSAKTSSTDSASSGSTWETTAPLR